MKKRLTSPTFDASEKTVTHASFSDVGLAGIQLIVNVTDQIIIYNFADTTKGGTLSTDTLTLEYDTTSMSDTDELMVLVEDGAASESVSVASSALPSGAATSAKQDTQITAEQAIQTSVELIDDAIRAEDVASGDGHKGVVMMAVRQDTPANTSNTDGDYEMPKMSAGRLWVDASGKTLTVDGSGVTQPVSNAGLTELAAAINSNKLDINIASDGVGIGGGTQYTEGDTDSSITGTAILWEDTSDTLRAVSASKPLPIGDAGGSLTIDGTVTANLSATDNGVLDNIDADTSAIQDAVESIDTKVATETTLATVQGDTSDIATNTGDILTSTGAASDAAATAGSEGTIQAKLRLLTSQIDAIKTSVQTLDNAISGNELQVDVLTMPTVAVTQSGTWDEVGINDSGNSITVDQSTASNLNAQVVGDVAAADTDGGNPVKIGGKYNSTKPTLTDGQRGNVELTSRGAVVTTLFSNDTATAISAEADNADDVAASSTANNLSTVARLTMYDGTAWDRVPGTSADGLTVNLGSNNDVSLNAGTNAVGKLLPPDIDVTGHSNYARKYYTSATPTDGIIWSPAAGKRWHVVTMYINVSAASTVTLEDDKSGGDDPVWKGEIAANSGVVLHFPEKYPMASGEDAADLTITATAGTVYVTCVGYEI